MATDNLNHQVMAFAAIAQCAQLAHDIARTGLIDSAKWEVCVNSLVCTDPDSAMDIYTPKHELALGFKTLIVQLSDSGEGRSVEITKYIAGMISLERKLTKSGNSMSMMGQRLDQVKRQLHHFTINDDAVIANFASIYSDIISPLGAKIQVSGSPNQLQQQAVQQKIRTLLLAGVRAAVLWRQVGGKRRHLFFNRKDMVKNAKLQLNQF
ncbi:high frequency lysogenization protein HflD [Psychrobium sp. 1_MG-2023]|uniref:high frequency lysogenization protein HflD n=1 Tax=Psychrobium sp. 1_MG-2023 TaxID=3062624 RepID=UPI000C34A981|nr:high frequency lysogenization protein HflD [Psychrobium sp. 1_MG-2023]MDP2561880.1 high frequency lysogenization protein HflD [Psychrobium sp. 1_MG-2023]PKF59704.1 lysogenization regulator HflD [Alteromonadales bacterium alter-6D02]